MFECAKEGFNLGFMTIADLNLLVSVAFISADEFQIISGQIYQKEAK